MAFLASLVSPATLEGRTLQDAEWGVGWPILLFGWLGPLDLQFGWFANPLIVVSVLMLLFGKRLSLWLAVPTALLALQSFSWTVTPTDASMPNHVFGRGTGFYLWIAAALGVLAAAIGGRVQGALTRSMARSPREPPH